MRHTSSGVPNFGKDTMNLKWGYPLYLVRIEYGFASVVDDAADGQRRVSVAVFTDEAHMDRFMQEVGIEEAPSRQIANDREFAYLLQSLQRPVTSIAFDSAPKGREINARWIVDVQDLLEKHLPYATSPWSYPVYLVAEPDGFSCIEGADDSRGPLRAMSVFTMSDGAEEYVRNARIEGSVETIDTPEDFRALLEYVDSSVTAIALDPTADGEHRTAKWCAEIATVLEKYVSQSS